MVRDGHPPWFQDAGAAAQYHTLARWLDPRRVALEVISYRSGARVPGQTLEVLAGAQAGVRIHGPGIARAGAQSGQVRQARAGVRQRELSRTLAPKHFCAKLYLWRGYVPVD